MARTTYIVAAGSNRCGRHGRPEAEVAAAWAALARKGKYRVTPSPTVASAPIGPSIRRYANAVALVRTRAGPEKLLRRLKKIERRFGRRPGQRWGARVIDLDIVLWSGGNYAAPGLIVPHPAFRTRRFVLDPLVRLAPAWRDPVTRLSIRQLHARLTRRRPLPNAQARW
jgi:2-amino-4-hydroxy-6-hydroxymethyldihydropteridine diphosphokinase